MCVYRMPEKERLIDEAFDLLLAAGMTEEGAETASLSDVALLIVIAQSKEKYTDQPGGRGF